MDIERASGAGDGKGMKETEQRRQSQEQEKMVENNGCRAHSVWRVINITFCFIMACTIAFMYVFANITPYMTSYLRRLTHGDVAYTDTLWVEQTATITACATMMFLGLLATKIPVRLFLLLGIFFNAVNLIGTYWTLKVSLWATLISYGVFGGLSRAILYPSIIKVSAQWAGSSRRGFVTGIVLMGFGIGPLVWNPLTTWYVNPDNVDTDLKVGEDRYYTQSAVLDKVPNMFLLVGCIVAGVQLLCLLFIWSPPVPETTTDILTSDAKETAPVAQESETNLSQSDRETGTVIQQTGPSLKEADKNSHLRPDAAPDTDNYTWKQVLKSRAFWTLWFIIVGTGFALSFVIPLYKAYGQTFIKDDHFLAVVATMGSVFNAAGRPFWGLLADRIGARLVLLAAQSLLAILVVTFLSCQETGKIAFMLWICAMFLSICAFYTMLPVLTLHLFGTHYFNVNSGLIDTSGVFGALLPTLIAPIVKDTWGWGGLFFVGFAGIFLGLLLNLSLEWCRCGDNIPQHQLIKLSIRRRTPKHSFSPNTRPD